MIDNDNYYHPDQALNQIAEQEVALKNAIDAQVVLQLLIAKNICTVDEINEYRAKVSSLPKYKTTLNQLAEERKAMEYAQSHPKEHLKAILNAKMNGTIK